uniref:Uncharacterized protein n=1 Tax=Setaria italica TaxID=4555 RepID=K4AN22_SETIT
MIRTSLFATCNRTSLSSVGIAIPAILLFILTMLSMW